MVVSPVDVRPDLISHRERITLLLKEIREWADNIPAPEFGETYRGHTITEHIHMSCDALSESIDAEVGRLEREVVYAGMGEDL